MTSADIIIIGTSARHMNRPWLQIAWVWPTYMYIIIYIAYKATSSLHHIEEDRPCVTWRKTALVVSLMEHTHHTKHIHATTYNIDNCDKRRTF